MKKILFNRQSPEVQKILNLIKEQSHRCLVLWVIDCAPRILAIFEKKYQADSRPREALNATIAWSKGEIKMPVAKKAAIDAHKAASIVEDDYAACAAAHAMGHVLGTVHVETHAMGLVMYGLTAFVRQGNSLERDQIVNKETDWFYQRLKYWESHTETIERSWAPFLLRNGIPNKEKLLSEKQALRSKNDE